MTYRGKSPSERFVSAVIGFIAGKHMHHKARPSSFSLFHESRQVSRQIKDLERRCDEILKSK